MIIRSIQLVISAAERRQFPQDGLPQVLLAGRSNVGKSSFINAILNNHKVARVSQTPGKTRLANFFLINQAFYLVDLPGYGFASVDKATKNGFHALIESYLEASPSLRLAVLLLDIRRVPNADDKLMKSVFAARGLAVLHVLTKADKLSNNQRASAIKQIRTTLGLAESEVTVLFSAKTKENRDLVWSEIGRRL